MLKSEIIKRFDESRDELKPYGLTFELWSPSLMRRADRHNEIEINYIPEGNLTYLFQDKKITIRERRLTVFWGLFSHQIVDYQITTPYYVCTIPFSQFLKWKLPSRFVDNILKGEVLYEKDENYALYDEFLFENWTKDMNSDQTVKVSQLELHARLIRMAENMPVNNDINEPPVNFKVVNQVEKIAIYIAQHYHNQLKVYDIGAAIGLHPDYANTIFKKAFGCTLNEYLIETRISHAQRKLVTTTMNITNIAYDCGFNSISRFNAAFLKINGCTPREFRKRY